MIEDGPTPEIVIVRRKRSGDGDGHHGGVWKIAYADFMTAMMAFFLVMWLINAANEETRSQVASYFNPVKLVDSSTNPRGLQDSKSKSNSNGDVANKKVPPEARAKGASDVKKQKKKKPDSQAGDNPDSEQQLFSNPLAALDEIVGQPQGLSTVIKAVGRPSGGSLPPRDEFRDPFEPGNWPLVEDDPVSVPNETVPREKPFIKPANKTRGKFAQQQKKMANPARKDKPVHAKAKLQPPVNRLKRQPQTANKKTGASTSQKGAKSKRLAEIKSALASEAASNAHTKVPDLSISRTPDGVLLSLTDDAKFGMFGVASARPAKEMVLFMEKIARVLAKHPGKIIIRGYTDGRPFHSKKYDNWRLSTARAHIARYMLVRGGVSESRFARIEGYADRKLKVPDKPYDARNRRIEILLLDKGLIP